MNYFRSLLKNADKTLLILPVIFAVISILMISSTYYDNGFVLSKSVIVQAAAYVLGFACMFFLMYIDYQFFVTIEKPLYIGSLLFLLTVYIPGLGYEQFGARSWINLGFTTFQPSEIVKITFVLLFAMYLARNRQSMQYFKGFIKAFLYAAPFIAIVAKEDMGSGLVFCSIWILMVFFGGIDYKILYRTALAFIVSLPILFRFLDDYQKQRITAFLHPDDTSIEATYQVMQAKTAIGSGGFFGKGLFQGDLKTLDFLPVQTSDFIYAVICEEFGFLGGFIVICLYAVFIYRTALTCHLAGDLYSGLIVAGFLGMFVFQIFENIGMTMGVMPVTGITLPFISYGGSSIVSNMMALGLILNVNVRSNLYNY